MSPRRCAGVGAQVEHAARAEGDLGATGLDATLADQRGLLVAEHRRDRRGSGDRGRVADDTDGVDDARQRRFGHAEGSAPVVCPHRAVDDTQPVRRGRRVRLVADVQRALAQRPGDPAVDCSDAQVAALQAGRVGEEPPCLGRRLVRSHRPAVLEFGHDALADGAQVLPPQPGTHRFAGRSVPDERARPLVGDADRGDRFGERRQRGAVPRRATWPPGRRRRIRPGRAPACSADRPGTPWPERRACRRRPPLAARWCRRRSRASRSSVSPFSLCLALSCLAGRQEPACLQLAAQDATGDAGEDHQRQREEHTEPVHARHRAPGGSG